MNVETPSLAKWLTDLGDLSKPFSFSRWGDGEWRSVLAPGNHYANCDGHQYFPEMGNDLRAVLWSRPAYRIGMQPLAIKLFKTYILAFLQKFKLDDLVWYDSDVFHKGAIAGRMDDILQVMNSRKVLLVGPAHLQCVPFQYWKQVIVPSRNVYLSLAKVLSQIEELLADSTEPLLVSISASMPAEILVDKLYHKYGHLHTIVDFGSLWDPLVGVKSRSYMRRRKK